MSALLLGDEVGWRRWLAVSLGFIGVLILLRPGADGPWLAYAAVLFAGFCYAGTAISARFLDTSESTLALAIYVMAGPLLLSAIGTLRGEWVSPDTAGWTLFFVAGFCSLVAWLGLVVGYRRASPAMLAPFEYTALVGGAFAGFLFWGEIPDRFTVAGSVIIVASGVFIAFREIRAEQGPALPPAS